MSTPAALTAWHDIVAARDPAGLTTLLADDVVFHSPVLHRPVLGRDLVTVYSTGDAARAGERHLHVRPRSGRRPECRPEFHFHSG